MSKKIFKLLKYFGVNFTGILELWFILTYFFVIITIVFFFFFNTVVITKTKIQ